MTLDQVSDLVELRAGGRLGDDQVTVQRDGECLLVAENVCLAARHSGCEVQADVSEDHDRPRRHVLASVITDAFDHGDGAGVADSEALTGRPRAEERSPRRAVESRVAEQARIAGIVGRRRHHDATAAHRLADVVVRLADELEPESSGEKGTEALTGDALEPDSHAAGRRA